MIVSMATMTVRMSDDLKDRAAVFAKGVGITLNALMAVALNDYLALRTGCGSPESRAREMDGAKPESPNLIGARGEGIGLVCGSHKYLSKCALPMWKREEVQALLWAKGSSVVVSRVPPSREA